MSVVVWVVGQYVVDGQWELQGVFSDEVQAVAACVEDSFFVGPVPFNEALSIEKRAWDGSYYPRLQKKPEKG